MSEVKENLKNEIQNLLKKNNEYKLKLAEITKIKEEKQLIENKINDIINILNLQGKVFVLEDNKIQHKEVIQYQNYSIKYLENCLTNYLNDNSNFNIKDFLNIVKKNRETKIKNELKIS